jgi:hypothetical protein
MPIYQAIEYELGLKALAWDYSQGQFISPARPEFTWDKGGLKVAGCAHGYGHEAPDWDCTCGLFCAWDLNVVYEYIHRSPVSPVFLCEASGKTIIHDMGWRAEELSIIAVMGSFQSSVIEKLAAHQASDYFQVPVLDKPAVVFLMDIVNMVLVEHYIAWSPVGMRLQRIKDRYPAWLESIRANITPENTSQVAGATDIQMVMSDEYDYTVAPGIEGLTKTDLSKWVKTNSPVRGL